MPHFERAERWGSFLHPTTQLADILVFPEAFVAGYPKGLDFGARLRVCADVGLTGKNYGHFSKWRLAYDGRAAAAVTDR